MTLMQLQAVLRIIYAHEKVIGIDLDRKSAYFCELARLGIDDVTMQIDILWYERVSTDGINRISYRILGVVEALQPMV